MTNGKNHIKRDQVAALFIPGLVQIKNGQPEKGLIFIILVMGMALS